MSESTKLKLYAVKTPDGSIASCQRSGFPLIGERSPEFKKTLEKFIAVHIENGYQEFKDCAIIKLKEV